jgi:hypothetical protein
VTAAPARGWLIDTNVVSELRKGPRCHRAVWAWSERVPRAACFISRVSLAEIRCGFELVTDPSRRAELEAWVQDGVLAWFGARVIEVDEAVLVDWRHLDFEGRRTRSNFSNPDGLLAATARVHHLGVVTRNVADFVKAGIRILNPWEEPA